MNCPDNITFSYVAVYSPVSKKLNNEQRLNFEHPSFILTKCKMTIHDVITGELFITFTADAELTPSKEKVKLQRLKLQTNTLNTYIISLRFNEGQEDVYALSGRYTSYKRELARKLFLAGLSNANYDTGIEKARQNTLYAFSSYISTTLFEPNILRIQQNIPAINNWLIRLLG